MNIWKFDHIIYFISIIRLKIPKLLNFVNNNFSHRVSKISDLDIVKEKFNFNSKFKI